LTASRTTAPTARSAIRLIIIGLPDGVSGSEAHANQKPKKTGLISGELRNCEQATVRKRGRRGALKTGNLYCAASSQERGKNTPLRSVPIVAKSLDEVSSGSD
jgi:hypothetical protein